MKHLRTLFLLFSTEVPKIIISTEKERKKEAFLHKQRLTLIKGLILILFLMSLKCKNKKQKEDYSLQTIN